MTSLTGFPFLREKIRWFSSRTFGITNGWMAAMTRGRTGSRAFKSHLESDGLSK
jgi:hypothetical protein